MYFILHLIQPYLQNYSQNLKSSLIRLLPIDTVVTNGLLLIFLTKTVWCLSLIFKSLNFFFQVSMTPFAPSNVCQSTPSTCPSTWRSNSFRKWTKLSKINKKQDILKTRHSNERGILNQTVSLLPKTVFTIIDFRFYTETAILIQGGRDNRKMKQSNTSVKEL